MRYSTEQMLGEHNESIRTLGGEDNIGLWAAYTDPSNITYLYRPIDSECTTWRLDKEFKNIRVRDFMLDHNIGARKV